VRAEPEPAKGETVGENEKYWRGSPLDMGGDMDPYGVREVVIEFENGDEDVFRPRRREEFYAYELHQMGAYIDAMAHSIRTEQPS
jgi:hypothetical protein